MSRTFDTCLDLLPYALYNYLVNYASFRWLIGELLNLSSYFWLEIPSTYPWQIYEDMDTIIWIRHCQTMSDTAYAVRTDVCVTTLLDK